MNQGAPSIDTDNSGWAHIAYIQLGCGAPGASTGYALRSAGTPVGFPNNWRWAAISRS